MIIKHPKYKFLNQNPNPTLEEVIHISLAQNKGTDQSLVNGFFFLNEVLNFSNASVSNLHAKCTPETFAIYASFQTIGCWQSGGLAIGVFGNFPQLVPYVSNAVSEIGYQDIGKAIQNVIAIFPEQTNFSQNDALYCDILNLMENPKRKTTHPLLQHINAEEKQGYHQNYIEKLNIAETLIETQWFWKTKQEEYHKLKDYYQAHKAKRLFK